MIACLQGELFYKSDEKLIVMAGGVGYEVHATAACLGGLPETGHQVFVHIHTHVREDALLLYGFFSEDEKETFLLLLTVSGVGPKLALAILSGISPGELGRAIRTDDLHRLTKLSGVGKKTAERLCLELKDKVKWIPDHAERKSLPQKNIQDELARDTVSALVNLGYTQMNAESAVQKVISAAEDTTLTLEDLFKQALRQLT
ncbi:MAG: Holliday junction branch migration protein RuvA [Desulfobulbaceae bacterium]|nr:Holliday junction branch migration protein RuvA [Desulfobulbaceae bacterium]